MKPPLQLKQLCLAVTGLALLGLYVRFVSKSHLGLYLLCLSLYVRFVSRTHFGLYVLVSMSGSYLSPMSGLVGKDLFKTQLRIVTGGTRSQSPCPKRNLLVSMSSTLKLSCGLSQVELCGDQLPDNKSNCDQRATGFIYILKSQTCFFVCFESQMLKFPSHF